MNRNFLALFALDTLAVVVGWVIYLINAPPDTALFIFASQTILVLGLLALGLTFMYSFLIGGINRYFWVAIVILIIGTVLTFFNWFAGGVVVLAALILLVFSRERSVGNHVALSLIFIGFVIMTFLPPIEAMFNIISTTLDTVVIIISVVIILVGLYISLRKILVVEAYLGYIVLSLAFFLLPPYHEIFGIKSNGSYGMYDIAIIIISTLLYFIFLSASLYAMFKEESAAGEIERGYEKLRSGEWEEAHSIFSSLHTRGHIYASVLNGLGVALMHMGRYDESEKRLKEALKIRENPQYRTNLGNLYYRRGDINKAMEVYRDVLKKNPDCYLALNNLGRCLMRKGKFDEAREYLKRAMKVNPESSTAKKNYSLLKDNGE